MKELCFKRFFGIAFIVLLMTVPAGYLNAQGSGDQFFYGDEKDGFQGTTSLNFSLLKGQTEMYSLETSGSLGYRKGKSAVLIEGSISYGESFDVLYMQKNYLQLQGAYRLNKVFSIETLVYREHDKFELIKERYWLGGGVRMNLGKTGDPKKTKSFSLSGGVNFIYEIEQFYDAEGIVIPERIEFLKFASLISFKWKVRSNFSLSSTTYFLFALKAFKEHDLHTVLLLSTKISKIFSFNTSMKYTYDNTVPSSAKKYSFSLTSGVTLKF